MDFLLCRSSVKQCLPWARHLQKSEQKREALYFREKMRRNRELELYLQLEKREAIGDARKTVEVDSRRRESYCECDSSVDVVSELLELKEATRRLREAEYNGELIKDDDDDEEDGNRDGIDSSSSSSSQSYETAREEWGGDDDCEQTGA